MDFGATVCKPFAPACIHCPLNRHCKAFAEARVNRLPVKEKTLLRKNRWFYYFLFSYKGKYLLNQRRANDIWENLFEFYLLETEEQVTWDETKVLQWLREQIGIRKAMVGTISSLHKQQLTHQQIRGQFIRVELESLPRFLANYRWETPKDLQKLAFPKFITAYLEQEGV